MTEISLIVTLNNQFNSTQLNSKERQKDFSEILSQLYFGNFGARWIGYRFSYGLQRQNEYPSMHGHDTLDILFVLQSVSYIYV